MNPWETEEGKTIWKTKSEYFGWLRGAIRRIWSDYPLRKEWKKRQLRPVTKEEKENKVFHPSTKNVGQCYYCSNWFAGSKLECDHKTSSNGCKSKEEAEQFLWYCGGQTGSMWVLACKPCHVIKTYMDKNEGITFEQARIDKEVIAVCKGRGNPEIEWLQSRGIEPEKNKTLRKKQVKKYLEDKDGS